MLGAIYFSLLVTSIMCSCRQFEPSEQTGIRQVILPPTSVSEGSAQALCGVLMAIVLLPSTL